MKNAKKVLSVLLSLMLVLGTVAAGGMNASADEYDYLIEVEDITFGETEKVTVTAPYESAEKNLRFPVLTPALTGWHLKPMTGNGT